MVIDFVRHYRRFGESPLCDSYISTACLVSLSNGVLTNLDNAARTLAAVQVRQGPMLSFEQDLGALGSRMREASQPSPELLNEIVGAACRRLPSLDQGAKTAHIQRLIASASWIDAALALIDFELPLWRVRRLSYDSGEWYCALSRERELPDWLDQCLETRHADLALAILCAFVEAQRISKPERRASVPAVERTSTFYEPLCVDNLS